MAKKIAKTVVKTFQDLSFDEYNLVYLMLKHGTIKEAAIILDLNIYSNITFYLNKLAKYDNLLYETYKNHESSTTRLLLEKQTDEDLDKVKKSYNNIQNIKIDK